jgi:hypothetical protein
MPRGDKGPDVYVITLHDDADYSAHIQELEKVISVENARVANGNSETTLISYVDFEIFKEARLPFYSGTFSKPVLRWIRARQEVKGIKQDAHTGST